jgi:hypothetical protein
MSRHARLERIANFLTLTVAFLLATAIIALAQPAPVSAGPGMAPSWAIGDPVRIALSKPAAPRMLSLPEPISQNTSGAGAIRGLLLEQHCLAEAVYFEARGESDEGQLAVARVILRRLSDGSHGRTICAVVYEGANQGACQFTFACDGSLNRPKEDAAWQASQILAARLLAGEVRQAETAPGATFYHALPSHPNWAARMDRVARIGHHIFYRTRDTELALLLPSLLE